MKFILWAIFGIFILRPNKDYFSFRRILGTMYSSSKTNEILYIQCSFDDVIFYLYFYVLVIT